MSNERKKLESIRRAITHLNQDSAKNDEVSALIVKFGEIADKIRAAEDDPAELHRLLPQAIALISRIERLAGEKATTVPGWKEWVADIRAHFAALNETRREFKRSLRMAVSEFDKVTADSVTMTGTICSVCNHRQAQTQIDGVWLCKRCARELGELPKGRAIDQ